MFRACFNIFLYLVIICPVLHVYSKSSYLGLFDEDDSHEESPCEVCPRQGKCVPRIQCPAHLIKGSNNPECHLRHGAIGICCFTGMLYAVESDLKSRLSSALSGDDLKSALKQSQKKLSEWLEKTEKLSKHKDVVVNETTPSYGHHMSLMSSDEGTEKLGREGLLNLFAVQELKAREAIDENMLALGYGGNTDGPYCSKPPSCPSQASRYRTLTGECNNPTSTDWGAKNTGYERLLPPDYSDGVWEMRVSTMGLPLPSARKVSSTLILDGHYPSLTHNLIFMEFGQFTVHDTTAASIYTIGSGKAISCCSGDGEQFLPSELQHSACAPIVVDSGDEFYGLFGLKCLNFVRAKLAPSSDCSVGYVKQMNGATHYADLSQLYGSTEEKLKKLRDGGLMKTFNDYGRDLPPLTERKECLITTKEAACFESGDARGNMIIPLTAFHTIFTREHNRVARALCRLNPDWSEDTLFMETRRIVQAEFQHIIFNEYIPLLLGPQLMETFGLMLSDGYASCYDPHVNPSITAEFAAAAMRFGHSVVNGNFEIPRVKAGLMHESISIPEVMFQPARMRLRQFLDRLLVGLSRQPMQCVDPFVTEGLTRYLFTGGNAFGLDLASINIQRGRDFGLRSYNHYRQLCGLSRYDDFDQFPASASKRLASVYASPDDIDLWVGGLLEEPLEGAIVGPTFAHILADQYSRMMRGDRYFYANGPDVNPGAFTPSQLAEIKKVTLSRIFCDNSDGIELTSQPPNAFLRADLPDNEPVSCESNAIPGMDLSRFKEV